MPSRKGSFDSAAIRRAPTQARSRARVDRILAAAADIVEAEGADALSVAALARRAKVPVGTLYQFFAGKDDIVQALAEKYVEGVFKELDELAPRLEEIKDWESCVDEVLSTYARYYRATPGLRALWVGARVDPQFVRHDHLHNNPLIARRLATMLVERAVVPLEHLETMMLCAWEAGQALIEQAFRSSADGDPAVLIETRHMLVRYLGPAFDAPS